MGMLEDIMKALDRIPAWKRVNELPAEVEALRARIAALEAKLAGPTGETCPRCREPKFMLQTSRPDPSFGDLGVRQDDFRCSACGYEDQRMRKQ